MDFKILLDQVSDITRHYLTEAEKTGENFNVFRILGLSTKEVRTHTSFLKELLDPKGSHGQGNIFLKLFLDVINFKDFEFSGVEIHKEFIIGVINEKYNEGGNLDILIYNNKGQAVVIENKIYAEDQRNQLLRYNNYCVKRFDTTYKLIYLTLDGRKPSEYSTGGFEFDYISLSYNERILNWLEKCIEIESHPIVKETIQQYIHLIQSLTKKSKSFNMNKDVIELVASDIKIFNSAEKISEAFNELKTILIPQSANNAITANWNAKFGSSNEQLVLFSFDNYDFKVSISDEFEFHLQITPWKKIDNRQIFGVADDSKIREFKTIIHTDEFKVFSNKNYTMWYYSQFRFSMLDPTRLLSLYNPENANLWSQDLISEAEGLIRMIIRNINNSHYSKEVIWNESNPSIKSLLGELL